MAANIWRPAGVNNNWGNSLNWSLLTVPTASDGNVATFDANALSGPCTVDASNRVCNGIDFSAYNNTITMTFIITVSGAITLGASMTIAGASLMVANTTATLTSNGKTWPNTFSFAGTAQTYTLADNWTVSGIVTFSNAVTSTTVNGNTMNCAGGLTGNANIMAGTTTFNLTGGTWVAGSTSGSGWRGVYTFGGAVTLSGTLAFSGSPTLTWISGTITTAGSTILWNGSGVFTINCGSNVTFVDFNTQSGTITLSSDLYYSGTWTRSNTTTVNANNVRHTGASGGVAGAFIMLGTTTWNFQGTGTLSAGNWRVNTTINTAGTVTIGTITFDGTLTVLLTAGTIVWSGTQTWQNANISLTNNISVQSGMNFVIATTGGGLTITFNGSFGLSFASLVLKTNSSSSAVTLILSLKFGNTYTITESMSATIGDITVATPQNNRTKIQSATGGSKVVLNLNQGATQSNERLDFLDVDASARQTIWTFRSTITTSLNINALPTQPKTIAHTSVG